MADESNKAPIEPNKCDTKELLTDQAKKDNREFWQKFSLIGAMGWHIDATHPRTKVEPAQTELKPSVTTSQR